MFQVLDEVCTPQRATKYSSCIDLFAREDVVIGAGETKVVPLGVKIDLDFLANNTKNYKWALKNGKADKKTLQAIRESERDTFMKSHCLELKCRSSLPLKKGLIIANGEGEIDLDYPDEIGILLHKPLGIKDIPFMVIDTMKRYFYDTFSIKAVDTPTVSKIKVKKGDKIAQIKLVEHKSYLFGIESNEVRTGGYGSSGE